jgi:hypothetical protein
VALPLGGWVAEGRWRRMPSSWRPAALWHCGLKAPGLAERRGECRWMGLCRRSRRGAGCLRRWGLEHDLLGRALPLQGHHRSVCIHACMHACLSPLSEFIELMVQRHKAVGLARSRCKRVDKHQLMANYGIPVWVHRPCTVKGNVQNMRHVQSALHPGECCLTL